MYVVGSGHRGALVRVVARICHGRSRGAREPVSWIAPALRAAAWGLVCLSSLALLLMAGAYAVSLPVTVAVTLVKVGVTGLSIAFVLGLCAAFARPQPLTLPNRRSPLP